VGFFEERPVAGSAHYRSMRHPVHYSETPASYFAEPPSLDADGDEIREALGPVSHFVKP
jgi:crotonobetainyl-CoA:carnitine CoA-transferase CaiB-like acyl-CoA transferase